MFWDLGFELAIDGACKVFNDITVLLSLYFCCILEPIIRNDITVLILLYLIKIIYFLYTAYIAVTATVLHNMYRRVKRVSRVVNSAVGSFSNSSSCSLTLTKGRLTCFFRPVDLQKSNDVGGDFMKWGSLSYIWRSSFASGYEPLIQKPLGEIIDIRKAVLQSP